VAQDLSARVAELVAAGVPCAVATVVRCEAPTSARPGDKALITGEGRLEGWIGGSCAEPLVRREALLALADGQPRLVRIVPGGGDSAPSRPGELTMATTCPSGGSLEVFVDPRLPPPLLAAFGDSPAAHALVKAGAIAGFRTCAVHPGARSEDFPGADLVLSELDLGPANPGPDTWAIVATMGHYDEDALAAALAHPGVDVALVASARRAAAVLEVLRQRGFSGEALAEIRVPAGHGHGATQEEIAILALAEVIALRRARTSARPAPEPEEAIFATDPVCGMAVQIAGAMHTLVAGGQTTYFCSASCLEAHRQTKIPS
jgi:xanthine dehydrogenase accessory factor